MSIPSSSKSAIGPVFARSNLSTRSASHALASIRPLSSESKASSGMPTIFPPTDAVTSHLHSLLSPLDLPSLPPSLAERIVTHRTAAGRLGNHNGRLAFYGRRVLHFHLAMHMHSQGYVSQSQLESMLAPIELGRAGGVGQALQLEQVMRWRPALPASAPQDTVGRSSGLWRLRGEAVQSLQGAVWSHYGAKASEAFFNAHILKRLQLPSAQPAATRSQSPSQAAASAADSHQQQQQPSQS